MRRILPSIALAMAACQTGDRVDGDYVLYWPTEGVGAIGDRPASQGTHELMQYSQRGRCDEFKLCALTGERE